MPPVLIIEPDDSIRTLLSDVLSEAGYTIAATATADQARRWLRQHRPAAVLCEARLPDMDGTALCATLSHDPRLAIVPIVLMSTDATLTATLPNQWVTVLSKPFALTTVVTLVAQAVGLGGL